MSEPLIRSRGVGARFELSIRRLSPGCPLHPAGGNSLLRGEFSVQRDRAKKGSRKKGLRSQLLAFFLIFLLPPSLATGRARAEPRGALQGSFSPMRIPREDGAPFVFHPFSFPSGTRLIRARSRGLIAPAGRCRGSLCFHQALPRGAQAAGPCGFPLPCRAAAACQLLFGVSRHFQALQQFSGPH